MLHRVGLALLLISGLGTLSCTLLFGSLTPAVCEDGQASQCQGNVLVRCEAGFLIEQSCAPGICIEDATGAFCQDDIPLNCGNGDLDEGEQCDDGNNIPGDGCNSNCTFSAPDLVITGFEIERHDRDLNYFVTVTNRGDLDLDGFIRVDVYHDRDTPPSDGISGNASAFISSLPAGSSATVAMLIAVAENNFDSPGTTRNDWAQVDPINVLEEGNEDNNVAGPLNGAVVRDFCTRCNQNNDCDVGECLTINETDEQFCSGAPCNSDDDCNANATCVNNRCRPILATCNANCDPRAEVIDIQTTDFVDNGDGTFTATFTGSTFGNPDLTGPRTGGDDDPCNDGEGDGGEVFFILHLTEGAFPNGLLGSSPSADVIVDTVGTSNFGFGNDTMLYMRTECMNESFAAQIDCDDDSGPDPGLDAMLTVTQLLKGTYVIVLDGFDDDNQGDFVVNITVDPN